MLIKIKKFIIIFYKTFLLDVYDLNFSKSSEDMNYHSVMRANPQMIRRGVAIRTLSFFYHMIKNIKTIHFNNTSLLFDTLIFVNSVNQKSALEFLNDKFEHSETLGVEVTGVKNFPIFWAYLVSIFFIPLLSVNFFRGNNYQRKSFQYGIDDYMLIYGFYLYSSYFLLSRRVKILILSNDHMGLPRTLRKAAQDNNIKTVYLQHASISSIYNFPKLEFDYAFLEGLDSLKKYNSYGFSKTNVILTGSPKFDKYISFINKNSYIKNLGIAITNTDDFLIVEKLIRKIQKFNKFNITIRPHPGDRQFLKYKELANSLGISFSNSEEDLSFEFLKNTDAIISGNSNIILEAALLNVFPFRYLFSDDSEDNYGFIENGLIEKIYDNDDELINKIIDLSEKKPIIRDKAKYFVATVNTQYDGISSIVIMELISQISKNGEIKNNSLKQLRNFKNLPNSFVLN